MGVSTSILSYLTKADALNFVKLLSGHDQHDQHDKSDWPAQAVACASTRLLCAPPFLRNSGGCGRTPKGSTPENNEQ